MPKEQQREINKQRLVRILSPELDLVHTYGKEKFFCYYWKKKIITIIII